MSLNVRIDMAETLPLDFLDSDHEPVLRRSTEKRIVVPGAR